MPKKQIKASHKVEKELEKEITSKDLTRSELLKYIFGDFIRGFYIFGCLFLDGLIVARIYFIIPFSSYASSITKLYFSGTDLYAIYITLITILIGVIVVFYQIKYYLNTWVRKTFYLSEKK